MLKKFNNDYEDRGMVKWMGMFLSEHTTSIEEENKRSRIFYPQKIQMSEEAIFSVLNDAILKNKRMK